VAALLFFDVAPDAIYCSSSGLFVAVVCSILWPNVNSSALPHRVLIAVFSDKIGI
jgi:hypothetical protein